MEGNPVSADQHHENANFLALGAKEMSEQIIDKVSFRQCYQ